MHVSHSLLSRKVRRFGKRHGLQHLLLQSSLVCLTKKDSCTAYTKVLLGMAKMELQRADEKVQGLLERGCSLSAIITEAGLGTKGPPHPLQLELIAVQAQKDEAQAQRQIAKHNVTEAQIAYDGFLRDLDAAGCH